MLTPITKEEEIQNAAQALYPAHPHMRAPAVQLLRELVKVTAERDAARAGASGIRAKFSVVAILPVKGTTSSRVELAPVYADTPENKAFWNATPAGLIQLEIVKQDTANRFVVGGEYYVDFIPAAR